MIADALEKSGHQRVAELADASIVVINTCAIRAKAEEKAFSFLGEAAQVVGSDHIVFMGCTATLDHERAAHIAGHGLHVLDGEASIDQVLHVIGDILPLRAYECVPPHALYPTASIEIVRGCESYCTYCIVPRARGPEVALPETEILRQARTAIAEGFSELLLLGQNINKYQWNGTGLVQLMMTIDAFPARFWLWFLSSHPANFTVEEIQKLMTLEHVEHRLHLPLQSGSDRVLRQMNRRYTVAQYAALVAPIRADATWSLTTDIIVGFPGETEEDFSATVETVRRFRFDAVFLAKYSDRPDTPASRMQNKIPRDIIDRRHSLLLSLVQTLSEENNQRWVDHIVEVLVLVCTAAGEKNFGRTRDGRNMWFISHSNNIKVGSFIQVFVEHVSREGLYGHQAD